MKRGRYVRGLALAFGVLVVSIWVGAQAAQSEDPESGPTLLSIQVTPGVEFPLQGDDRPLFRLAYGTDIIARLPLRFLPVISPAAGLAYTLAPVRAETSVSTIGVGLGGSAVLDMGRVLVTGTVLGGGYFGFFNQSQVDPEGNPYDDQAGAAGYLSAAVDASFFVTPFLSIGLGGLYHNYLGLYHSARAHLSTTLHLEGLQQRVGLRAIRLDPIFPTLMQYYGDNSLGEVMVTNNERFPISNVEVALNVPGYMRRARETEVARELLPGESRSVPIYALFKENVLDLLEGAQVPAEITVSYALNGRGQEVEIVEAMQLHHRNALTWDDDRKAAAFVTAKDSEVIRFASSVAALVRREGPSSVNPNLRMGMGMFNAISEYGLSYVIDPNTPAYIDASENLQIIDFLQFPRQTLNFRGGDCDDLSILYCGLLESVGVPTAFVTIPGHIFAAFSLGISVPEARQFLWDDRLVIDHDGAAWIPVEVTLVGDDFQEAWETGAKQWRDNVENDAVGFYPNGESWQTYPAAGWAGEGIEIDLPASDLVQSRYNREIIDLVQRQLMPQLAHVREQMDRSRNPVRYMNRIGVLYAQYGLIKEAEEMFHATLLREEYPPALINLGNLYYLRDELEEALSYFERAAVHKPEDPVVLLNLARINSELDQFAKVRLYYAQLEEADPNLGVEFAYLGSEAVEEGARAADVDLMRSRVYWDGGELPEEAE